MVDRRTFIEKTAFYSLLMSSCWARGLPARDWTNRAAVGSPAPIPEPHFPGRLHEFVWRNWELANTVHMADVIKTSPEKVLNVGISMGLPKKQELSSDQLRRIYITVIRQNWHLLPDEQLIELLGWSREQYEYHLKEDDFLWTKLGSLKPRCERLIYRPPSKLENRRAAEIKALISRAFGDELHRPGEAPFEFIRELSTIAKPARHEILQTPSKSEVDLRVGWTLAASTNNSQPLSHLVESFGNYVRSTFGCELKSSGHLAAKSKTLRFSLDTSLFPSKGGFLICVEPQTIHVTASDEDSLRNSVYELENLMEERQAPYIPVGEIRRTTRFNPRYVYSYFALYGDPLLEEDIDSFPDGLLERLTRGGVNGVWLQGVLRNLAPSSIFPEFGESWETRLRNLNKLIQRASRHGVKVYLYINEPRSMPAEFFRHHPGVKGTHDPDNDRFFAMCTSTEDVRQWLADSMAHLFLHAPGLGGIFCITASENLTNCYSHGHPDFCPRCSKRAGSDVIAEVIETLRSGVRRSSARADVIAWDWGWGKDWVLNGAEIGGVISKLSKDVVLLSVSEWGKAIDRGGFQTKVGEYSISVVGPGARAEETWRLAQESHKAAFAKVQWDNSWEISAVPYIPVPYLILEHCENLVKAGVQGLMVSWTLGGYPSPNFETAKEFYFTSPSSPQTALRRTASRRYGAPAVDDVLEAWKTFSQAFSEYPMDGGGLVYHIPTQHGPANLLRLHPTGYKSSMILFPYDDYTSWVGPYPVEVVGSQFAKMAREWRPGLDSFRKAVAKVPPEKQKIAHQDLGIAETCYLHFQSVANQIHFYRLRDQWLSARERLARARLAKTMVGIAEQEMELAKRQYAIAKRDSAIAFEASNHYYYRPIGLVEKVLNCQYVIDQLYRLPEQFRD